MSNPFESPAPSPLGPVPPMNGGYATGKVNGPATALLVIAVINLVLALWGVVNSLMTLGRPQQAVEDLPPMEGMDPNMTLQFIQGMGVVGVVVYLLAIAIAVVILMGALKMKRLQSWGLAMAAAILAMIPCLSPCCLLGLPFGIWALVVLNDPQVKSAFH